MIWRVVFSPIIRQTFDVMNDDELDDLIRQTHPRPDFSASFQREIWGRIAVAEQTSWTARCRRWSESFFQQLARPALAVTAVMTMLLLGAGLGRLTTSDDDPAALRSAYITSINPLAASHPSNGE